jgi:hypothetical protein
VSFVPVEVDFSTGDEKQIVASGNRITGLVSIRIPRGITFGVKFGNNQYVTGFSGKVTWDLTDDSPASDNREGLWIRPDAPAPGVVGKFAVSYG